jgi:hypothetical protein
MITVICLPLVMVVSGYNGFEVSALVIPVDHDLYT